MILGYSPWFDACEIGSLVDFVPVWSCQVKQVEEDLEREQEFRKAKAEEKRRLQQDGYETWVFEFVRVLAADANVPFVEGKALDLYGNPRFTKYGKDGGLASQLKRFPIRLHPDKAGKTPTEQALAELRTDEFVKWYRKYKEIHTACNYLASMLKCADTHRKGKGGAVGCMDTNHRLCIDKARCTYLSCSFCYNP
jgi:hypothetical protein